MDLATHVVVKALVVELIRRLWHRGLLSKTNKIANQIHDNWFEFWVEYKTAKTMAEVDEQIEAIHQKLDEEMAAAGDPVYSEILKGETALGGPMQASHPVLGQMEPLDGSEHV